MPRRCRVFNSKTLLLDDSHIGSAAEFASFLQGPRRPAQFAPRLLDATKREWKEILDLMLTYAQRQPDSLAPINTDWVEAHQVHQFSLEHVQVEQHPGREEPRFSLVIPFRDRERTLPFTLQALARLQSGQSFEVILVDDGSRAVLPAEITATLNQVSGGWTLVRLPPSLLFRAGFARNVGVQYARGEFLVFLDSDILLPADFLSELDVQFDEADLIQAKRWQIWSDQWSKVDPKSLLTIQDLEEPNPFWRDFQNAAKPWAQMEQPWKYASTFCLSLRRSQFVRLGGFRLWYSSYGFEDTDLGLRAYRQGLRLHRLESNVFHLAPHARGTWTSGPQSKRDGRLRRSARKYLLINNAVDSLEWLAHLVL